MITMLAWVIITEHFVCDCLSGPPEQAEKYITVIPVQYRKLCLFILLCLLRPLTCLGGPSLCMSYKAGQANSNLGMRCCGIEPSDPQKSSKIPQAMKIFVEKT